MTDNQTTEASVPASLRPALQALVAEAVADAAFSEELASASEDELATADMVKDGLEMVGVNLKIGAAYQIWSLISLNSQAGWLYGPRDAADALVAVLRLCQDIAQGADYAGFSGKG
ncbi:MAG: hypothetical protein ABF537_15165 [Acetobacter sp.]|uniref:Uncharacterized protein n=1 Tax=Acetobacter malorum TaxID=178901 RepID=A0A149VHZ4_9PROT|nr:hypothetical protein [Acetobacter malorum]KXV79533.1 hypothetical protein AD953_01865 [Acetobacter malorum]